VRLDSVAIVGYGTAGQAAALYLRRQGCQVEHFERAPQLQPRGAGFLLQPTGLAVLADLGLAPAALACGARVDALIGRNERQRLVMDMHYARLDPAYFGLGMQRGALFQILRDADSGASHVRAGVHMVAVDRAQRALVDAHGRRYGPYQLIIIADGAHSQLRQTLAEHVRREPLYPWGALWCLAADPDRRWDARLEQRYHLAHTMMGVLPVGTLPGEGASEHRVSIYWSSPVEHGVVKNVADFADWRRQVERLWSEAAPLLDTLDHPQFQLRAGSYRDVLMRRFSERGVVLIGDAAHGMSPQLGQGVNMALLDAQALSYALETEPDLERALQAYERDRRRHLKVYQLLSRWLTPVFQSHHDWLARCRDLAFAPLGRLPVVRQEMLKILSGTKTGWFGRWRMRVRTDAV